MFTVSVLGHAGIWDVFQVDARHATGMELRIQTMHETCINPTWCILESSMVGTRSVHSLGITVHGLYL